MKVYNLKTMPAYPYDDRDRNVFYNAEEFKTRIVELPPGGAMPKCEMESYVIFFVVSGAAVVSVNKETTKLETGQCMITEPATISMKTEEGVKLMGVQIAKR